MTVEEPPRYGYDEIMKMVNEGAQLVQDWDRASLDERDTDLVNLVVNAIGSVISQAAAGQAVPTVEEVILGNYDAEPEDVEGWLA